MGTPQIETAVTKAFVTGTLLALHDTALALARHRLRHGRFPDPLPALVPTYLPELPRDRMDGQPLRYRKEADDRFTLWSIGADHRDDGRQTNPGIAPAPAERFGLHPKAGVPTPPTHPPAAPR